MNFSAWSIRNPLPPILLFVVLVALGVTSFMRLPVTRFPLIDVPIISVVVTDPGVAPTELETQVTKKIEDAVANISGVKNVISTVNESRSTTIVEFRLEVQTQKAVTDVKDAIERMKSALPATAGEPVINSVDIEGQSMQTFAVTAPQMTIEELSWFVDNTVIRKLQGVRGIGRVDRNGGVTREVSVKLDPQRLMALGVTAANVNQALRGMNADLTGGRGDIGNKEQAIRTLGGARTIEDLAAIEIPLGGGRTVRLSDVAIISDSFAEPKSYATSNGQTVIAFSIYRAKGESDVTVADRAKAAISDLQKTHPEVLFENVDDSVSYTRGNFEAAMSSLVEGALLSVVVVFLFLRDWRATLISAAALPLSAIPTFWVMHQIGFSLNLVSLLGITLVVGILVDDAIVEIENIVRHIRMGKTPYRASLEAADEIGLAVIAISFTIIAIFAPVSFMSGVAGQYFKQFGLTVAIAVFFSLLVARLITPMMAAYFMREPKEHKQSTGLFMRGYLAVLRAAVRFRWVTLLGGILFFAGSIYAMGLLPSGFIPKIDVARVITSLELPPGSALEQTREITDKATAALRQMPEVKRVYVVGGVSPTGLLEKRRATVIVELFHKTERTLKQKELEPMILDVLSEIPDIKAYFLNDRGARELEIGVMGSDAKLLSDSARKLQSEMAATGKYRAITSNAALDRPEIIVVPDAQRLAELGLTTASVSETLRVATLGDIDENLAKFTVGDRQIPIRVQLDEAAREDIETLSMLPVPLASGASVPLASVASVRFGQGPSTIDRFNRDRRIVIGADMSAGNEIGEGLATVYTLPTAKALPGDVRLKETGDSEVMGEVFASFADAMIMGITLVFVVLILLFGSIFHAFTILLSLPLAIGGVAAGLLLTGYAVSMPVVIGILMLMGIVTKNAIMLVDFAVERVKQGMNRNQAIIDAGSKRAQPIVMTTIAMSAGMLPAGLALGDGGEFRAPMAIAVIGGLLVSTVLSLVFVPAVYTIMDDVARGSSWLIKKILNPNKKEEDEENTLAPAHAHPAAANEDGEMPRQAAE
ncbi:MAG: efflux RND transporter permease subunit [Rhizobiaceae bacterium]